MAKQDVPLEVRKLAGKAPKDVSKFWETPHPELDNKSPSELWEEGTEQKQRVIDFILAAKSGDMA